MLRMKVLLVVTTNDGGSNIKWQPWPYRETGNRQRRFIIVYEVEARRKNVACCLKWTNLQLSLLFSSLFQYLVLFSCFFLFFKPFLLPLLLLLHLTTITLFFSTGCDNRLLHFPYSSTHYKVCVCVLLEHAELDICAIVLILYAQKAQRTRRNTTYLSSLFFVGNRAIFITRSCEQMLRVVTLWCWDSFPQSLRHHHLHHRRHHHHHHHHHYQSLRIWRQYRWAAGTIFRTTTT